MSSQSGFRRQELGEFLKARRRQLVRADLGLPPVLGRGVSRVRREEVSCLSGVSVTWYTWLEQGRQIKPSRQVLDALARTLRLSPAEHGYILSLAGYSAPQPIPEPSAEAAPPHVQRLLESLDGFPAYAIAPDWAIWGWNAAYTALYRDLARVPAADRNLLWLIFTDPYLRELMPDWGFMSRRHVAQFRAEAGPRLGHPSFSRLVQRLLQASAAFRAAWESHDIEGFASRERLFRHPVVGDLHLEHYRLAPSDHPNLRLVIYTPVLATDSPQRLRRLVGEESRPQAPTSDARGKP
ncbi:helix-turn-helix domain-containing protein [Pseudonocardia xinjiangensis]|uniref:Helix-turn-helix domain-containing protein n=1 Tax=Pseudonocardia xinjiangensis TaxID=75289 RepID=A0ABX1R5U1_9PSEU|nr:helix-turn-helix domain-containing protein [Pseudonocardia xinjiangensis]